MFEEIHEFAQSAEAILNDHIKSDCASGSSATVCSPDVGELIIREMIERWRTELVQMEEAKQEAWKAVGNVFEFDKLRLCTNIMGRWVSELEEALPAVVNEPEPLGKRSTES